MYTYLLIHDRFLRSNKESIFRMIILLVFFLGILISTYALEPIEQSYIMTNDPLFYVQGCFQWYLLVSQVVICSIWIGGLTKESTLYDIYLIKPSYKQKQLVCSRFLYLMLMTLKWSFLLSISYISVLLIVGSVGWVVSFNWMHFAYHTLSCMTLGCMMGLISKLISHRIAYFFLIAWLGFWIVSFYTPSPYLMKIQEIIAIPSWNIDHYVYIYRLEHYLPFGILVVAFHLIFLNLYSPN